MQLVVDGRRVAPVEMAVTRAARNRGLLGRDRVDGALWIAPAKQVHTFRMRFAIDTAHLDRDGEVLHLATLPPGRLGRWGWRTHVVVEAGAGEFAAWGLRRGSRVSTAP